ncbi:hypothetical protein XaplCFBP3123_19405 [Xanthomonas arboricola pv. populi]|nr:hypothetical protein XaplCFBP3123_19405 [Xanthomonas arboricola pv. populi]
MAPTDSPSNTVPSSRTRIAGWVTWGSRSGCLGLRCASGQIPVAAKRGRGAEDRSDAGSGKREL